MLVAAAGAAAVAFVRFPGDVGDYGNGVALPMRVGSAISVGLADVANRGDGPLVIDGVRLHHGSGFTLLGAAVDSGRGAVGAVHGWPPGGRTLVPARGHRVAAHHRIDLLVGLRADRAGDLTAEGVDVLYHRTVLGIAVKLRDHVGIWIGACARPADERCNPPSRPD